MTSISVSGDDIIARRSLYGEPLKYQGVLLGDDNVTLVFEGLFSNLIAAAIVREEEVIFFAGKQEGADFLRCEFGLNV